jgi:hypothetical protein
VAFGNLGATWCDCCGEGDDLTHLWDASVGAKEDLPVYMLDC